MVTSGSRRAGARPSQGATAHGIDPARARLVAALALPLGGALLARMAGWALPSVLGVLALLAVGAAAAYALAHLPDRLSLAPAPHLDALTPREFERYVAGWFHAQGYRVELVGGSGDGGVDVRVWRGGRCGIVQCKRYGPAQPVGPAIIRELVGARTLAGLDHAWLATTGRVTAGARRLALAERIRLVDAATLGIYPRDRPLWALSRPTPLNSVPDAGMRLAEGDGEPA
jgi:restriction endonuclease